MIEIFVFIGGALIVAQQVEDARFNALLRGLNGE